MVTQGEVFQRIRQKYSRRAEPAPRTGEVTKLMKQLYHPSLEEERYFYSQDENGLPVAPIPTAIDGAVSFPTFTPTSVFNPEDWPLKPKPKGFAGKIWPPKSLADLLGKPSGTEYCIGCNSDNGPCNCNYQIWSTNMRDFVTAKIALRPVPGKWDVVAEYTGRIFLHRDFENGDADQYSSSIIIGGFNRKYEGHPSAHIDASDTGSIARFYNHSCEPNTQIWEYRCGMRNRALVFQTMRVIKEGEELTVDYGDEWFVGPGQHCVCGTASCRNPPLESIALKGFQR